ncbi:signal peptidase II [Patescibacteria group bacterium]|nr:signal peptidase II [Patescibacteria group bacterium]
MFTDTYNCHYLFSDFISVGVFILLSIILATVFSIIYIRNYWGNKFGNLGFLLILLGGLMNLSEWYRHSCVKDYLNFFNLFHFNFYDLLVTIGVVLVFITIWKKN